MTLLSLTSSAPDTRTSRQWLAIAALFSLNGALLASWASEVSRIKAALQLTDLELGVALSALTIGSILMLPLMKPAIARLGLKGSAGAAALLGGLSLAASAFSWDVASLAVCLLFFGAAFGALELALNQSGVLLEEQTGRPLLSGLHALFSFGALVGAVAGAALIGLGFPVELHLLVLLIGTVAFVLVFAGSLPQAEPPKKTSDPARQNQKLWTWPLVTLGLFICCAAIADGAMVDWASVYLRETVGSPNGVEALGFAGFSLAMLIGRIFGDRASEHWGAAYVGRVGALVAAVGIALTLAAPFVIPALSGFVLIGLGVSVLAPLAFSAVGRVAPEKTVPALAGLTAFFYAGYLAGPPIIGFLAELASLRVALVLVLAVAVAAACLSPILQQKG